MGRELEPLRRSWPATPDSVAAARAAVTAYLLEASTTTSPVEDVALAVSEAATTIVGNVATATARFTVTVTVEEDAIVLTIDDGGQGVIPVPGDPRSDLTVPVISGVSDGFVRRTMPDGSTQLWVVFPRET